MKTLIVGLFLSGLTWAHGPMEKNSVLTFAEGTIQAHITWEVGPRVFDESVFRVEWLNGEDHSPAELPGSFEVVLHMPSMNHGSAPTLIEPALDENGSVLHGVYIVSNVYFSMGGDWEVRVILNRPDGSKEIQKISLDLPSNGGHHGH